MLDIKKICIDAKCSKEKRRVVVAIMIMRMSKKRTKQAYQNMQKRKEGVRVHICMQ